MFIFGQALLQPLIGAECENVECALPWLSHDGTNSPAVITRTVLSLESISDEREKKKKRRDRWASFFIQMCRKLAPRICFEMWRCEMSRG